MIVGQPGRLVYADALYLSITVLTSTGFGDVTPLTRAARGLCMIEQIAGALFTAILIARLAGVYPPERVTRTTMRHRSSTTSTPGFFETLEVPKTAEGKDTEKASTRRWSERLAATLNPQPRAALRRR
jgi:hypothetical protein